MDEVLASYDFKKEVKIDKSELRCIEQQKRTLGMMDLEEMARFIESYENNVFIFRNNKASEI